jgi:hypothetical protein
MAPGPARSTKRTTKQRKEVSEGPSAVPRRKKDATAKPSSPKHKSKATLGRVASDVPEPIQPLVATQPARDVAPRILKDKNQELQQEVAAMKGEYPIVTETPAERSYDSCPELLAKEKARRKAAEKKAEETIKMKNKPVLKMIPRPKGSAGDRFNLCTEMGLEDKEQQYNAILVWTCLIWVSLIPLLMEDSRATSRD